MRKVRTTSANFSVRETYQYKNGFLMLDRPFPAPEDYEWALRISIDKYYFLIQNESIQDGGAYSSGLCFAAKGLSHWENRCSNCPMKIKTGKSNCEATPFKFLESITTWSDQGDIYKEMYALLQKLYRELYESDYEPKIMEDSDAVISKQKNKPTAGEPWGPVCGV
jgi:hypothetical protein